jgi:hypothetical protein
MNSGSSLLSSIAEHSLPPYSMLGEATGGKPNHYGEISSFILPNSEMTVSYCTKYFETTNGDPDALYPDIALPLYYSDFSQGTDPVMDYIETYGQ